MTHHPIYSEHYLYYLRYCYFSISIQLLMLLLLLSSVSIESVRGRAPRNWIPVGWMPVYDDKRDKRPARGYEATSARKIRLYRQYWIEFLDGWEERTKYAILLPWADGCTRSTRQYIGGVMGDQQEGDKYTGEPCVCHRFYAPRTHYLDTADYEVKTMQKVRQRVEIAAAGEYLKGSSSKRVVKWNPDGRNVRPGPGIIANIAIIVIIEISTVVIFSY